MKRFAIVLLLLCTVTAALFAQNDPDWFWNKPIAGVDWVGIRATDRSKLDALANDYIGKLFTDELWMDFQARLYALDTFASVDSLALPSDTTASKVIVRLIVVEKPTIDAIRVTGNAGLRTSEVLDAVKSKTGTIFNPAQMNIDDQSIMRAYYEKGFPSIKVTHSFETSADGKTVTLLFTVVEGEQVAVRSITFSGNESIKDTVLKGQMSLKEAGLFQPGAYQEDKFQESKTAILEYYRSKGYVDVAIADVTRVYEKDAQSGKNWLILGFVIVEGAPWKFGGMSFEGNTVFSPEKLGGLVSIKTGAPLNYKKLREDKQRIDDLYYESGYIFNTLTMEELRDTEAGTIAYVVHITERDRAHIENISIKGNDKTKDNVILRELPLEVGDVFSKTKVVDGLRNLYNLQYFSSVQPEMLPGSGENLMDLVLNVEEQSTAQIQFGLTLSGLGTPGVFPLSGFLKWTDQNFLGKGYTLSANATLAATQQSISASFGDAWLFNKRINGSITLSAGHNSYTTGQDSIAPLFTLQNVPDPFIGLGTGAGQWDGNISSIPADYLMPYDNWNISLTLSAGYTFKTIAGDINLGGGITPSVGMSTYDATRYRPYLASLRDSNGQWQLYDKIFTKASLNKLDLWYNPMNGYYASQAFTWAGLFSFEPQHYIRSDTRIEGYLTLFELSVTDTWKFTPVIGLHTGYQALFAQPGRDLHITQDWISLDGTFNARGWRNLFGMQGVEVWENWIELRLPILSQIMWLDFFFDAAAMRTQKGMVDMMMDTPAPNPAQSGFDSMGWNNMAFSMGFGLRFVFPQFPFRIYLAKRFATDGVDVKWVTPGADFDFVLSITQPVY